VIDPDHPDLGPKNNQFAFVWGSLKNGRGDLFKRFVGDSFGSINANGHTTVCQGSLYFTGKAMSEQFDGCYGEVHRRQQVLLADRYRQQRLCHLRWREYVRSQLRTASARAQDDRRLAEGGRSMPCSTRA
jgi:hypothetical protein